MSALDSVVAGEGQILAQVKNVFALGENVEGRHLSGLFKADHRGKRVRSETSIASGAWGCPPPPPSSCR